MLQFFIVGHAPWPLTQTAEPTESIKVGIHYYNTLNIDRLLFSLYGLWIQFCALRWIMKQGERFTRARAADDAVVDDGTAVDRNL